MWNGNKIEKSAKIFDEWTLVLHKEDAIFATSKNKDVVELSMNLDIVKKFHGRDFQPYAIDANENYLVVGYEGRRERCLGHVDVFSRVEPDENTICEKLMVRNCFSIHHFDLCY